MGVASRQISKLFTADGTANSITFSKPPIFLSGTTGDTKSMIAFDDKNIYYNAKDFIDDMSPADWKVTNQDEYGFGTYKALLSQTGTIIGNNIGTFDGGLIIGETYTITDYVTGDDFSNIANIQSGTINSTGCVFVATGEYPMNWNNGSQLTSTGNIVANVLENTLGYGINWSTAPFGGYGYYVGVNDTFGLSNGIFPKTITYVTAQNSYPYDWGGGMSPELITNVGGIMGYEEFVVINAWDWYIDDNATNALYCTPVEIKVKGGAPIKVNGGINASFPFNFVSVALFCNGSNITSVYGVDYTATVNNITELLAYLNNDPHTSANGLFRYYEGGDSGIFVTMPTYIKNALCLNGELTFLAFSDY